MNNTPPTEDRDWKEGLHRNFHADEWGVCQMGIKALETFVELEIATAEARGYERGKNEIKINTEVCTEGNCPFYPNSKQGWGGSPEFWEEAEKRHERHTNTT